MGPRENDHDEIAPRARQLKKCHARRDSLLDPRNSPDQAWGDGGNACL